jgi:hypothetical protein
MDNISKHILLDKDIAHPIGKSAKSATEASQDFRHQMAKSQMHVKAVTTIVLHASQHRRKRNPTHDDYDNNDIYTGGVLSHHDGC